MTPSSPTDQNAAPQPGSGQAVLVACRHCDLLQWEVALPQHGSAHCMRCHSLLYRGPRSSLNFMLAMSGASAILLMVSNLYPIASLAAQGINTSTTLYGTAVALYDQGKPFVAALVWVTTILIPALELAALLYMLLPLRFGVVPRGFPVVFRALLALHPWSMMEVFMLGVLITLVKLADLATVVPGISLWAFVGLIGLFASISASFSVRDLWGWVAATDAGQHMPERK